MPGPRGGVTSRPVLTGAGGETRTVKPPRGERARLAMRERLPMWVQLRCGLEPRMLAALAVVLVAAAVLAAQHFWSGRPQPVRPPERVSGETTVTGLAPEPHSAPGLGPLSGPSPSPGAPPAAPGHIVVDVSGEVHRPGVLRLPTGSRVEDALRAAGGAEAGTDLTGLNRARVLTDGEQVVVGGPPLPHGGVTGASGGSLGPTAQQAGPLSLNTATAEQLDTLPGVGPVLAQHIIDHRTSRGGFRSVEELREVNGIGERRFADLQPLVRP